MLFLKCKCVLIKMLFSGKVYIYCSSLLYFPPVKFIKSLFLWYKFEQFAALNTQYSRRHTIRSQVLCYRSGRSHHRWSGSQLAPLRYGNHVMRCYVILLLDIRIYSSSTSILPRDRVACLDRFRNSLSKAESLCNVFDAFEILPLSTYGRMHGYHRILHISPLQSWPVVPKWHPRRTRSLGEGVSATRIMSTYGWCPLQYSSVVRGLCGLRLQWLWLHGPIPTAINYIVVETDLLEDNEAQIRTSRIVWTPTVNAIFGTNSMSPPKNLEFAITVS